MAAALSAAGNLFGFARDFSVEFYAFGSLILPVLTVLSAGMQRNFVVKKGRKNHI